MNSYFIVQQKLQSRLIDRPVSSSSLLPRMHQDPLALTTSKFNLSEQITKTFGTPYTHVFRPDYFWSIQPIPISMPDVNRVSYTFMLVKQTHQVHVTQVNAGLCGPAGLLHDVIILLSLSFGVGVIRGVIEQTNRRDLPPSYQPRRGNRCAKLHKEERERTKSWERINCGFV